MASILNAWTNSYIFIGTNDDFLNERKINLNKDIKHIKTIFDIDVSCLKDGNMDGDYSLVSIHNPGEEMFEVFIANSILVAEYVKGFSIYRNPETDNVLCYPIDNVNPEECDFANYFVVLTPSIIDKINKTKAAVRAESTIVIAADDVDVKKGATFNLMGSGATIAKSRVIGNIKQNKIGRNEPCYCGSNKKYKHCHIH